MNPEPLATRPSSRNRSWVIPLAVLFVAVSVALVISRRRERVVTYRIGTVDARFGMSREAFGEALRQAASLWNQALAQEIFREAPKGVVEVNLIYDHRQEAADRLKVLSREIEGTQGTYEGLKAHFETLRAEVDQKKAALARDFAEYNGWVSRFNETRRQPMPEDALRGVKAEQNALAEMKASLLGQQEELKTSLETLNATLEVINSLAANHNQNMVDYNHTGDSLGPEFSEGEYIRENGRRSIRVYHIPSRDALVRVLAHELGHAKGLGHLDNAQAVMHRLMRTDNPELTSDDIAAMKAATR